jgi:TPR repeat protein
MIGRKLIGGYTAGALLAFAMVAPGIARAQDGAGNPTAEQPAATPNAKCDYLLSKFLPGDFNFCLAAQYWREGKREKAAEMLQLAAGWGNKGAQTALGVAYFNGDGIPQDRALGLAWLALAAERQAPTASGLYVSARGKVDAEEYERAIALYQQMRTTYADDVAAVRADNRYRREVRAIESNSAYGSGKCIAGFNDSQFADPSAPEQYFGSQRTYGCSLAAERRVLDELEQRYAVYAAGWNGRVSVGSVEPLKASGKKP